MYILLFIVTLLSLGFFCYAVMGLIMTIAELITFLINEWRLKRAYDKKQLWRDEILCT